MLPPPQPAATSAIDMTRSASQRITRDPNRGSGQVLREESDDGVVAPNAVRQLEDVMSLVLEDEVVDFAPKTAQLLDDVARLALHPARVVLSLDDEQRTEDVGDVCLG